MNHEQRLIRTIRLSLVSISAMVAFLVLLTFVLLNPSILDYAKSIPPGNPQSPSSVTWISPDSLDIPSSEAGDLIRFGQELVSNTSRYLGPNGSIMSVSNGMNCQNCHLKAGRKLFGNNYSAVASTYPKFRTRSGTVETIEKRVNDCIERSLNGKKIDPGSHEMKAFVAYILWVGKDVPKGVSPTGSGIVDLPFLDRATEPSRGKVIYQRDCKRCHGENGEGIKADESAWRYPPLWGNESFNTGAGLFRLSRLSGYVKKNMPQDVTKETPLLTDEEAWDVAAYINSMPRPSKDLTGDWPDIATKPMDHPFGPFADSFPAAQHKYGPFAPIKEHYMKK